MYGVIAVFWVAGGEYRLVVGVRRVEGFELRFRGRWGVLGRSRRFSRVVGVRLSFVFFVEGDGGYGRVGNRG